VAPGYPYWVFLGIYAIFPSVVLVTAPNFVRPTWNFPHLKWITLAAAVLTVLAVAATSV
jgi:hypothetical protein